MNCGLCEVEMQKYGASLLVGAWSREKQQNKLVNEERSLKCRFEKYIFVPEFLRLSVLP